MFEKLRMPQTPRRGFTIMELLISIAIIFIIITVALVGLKSAKRAADRTESSNALRQIMAGYIAYTNDHKGRLMPGYIRPEMIQTVFSAASPVDPTKIRLKAELQGGYVLNEKDTAPYVWRLAPYLDYAWKTYLVDYRSSMADSTFAGEIGSANGASDEAYGLGTIDPGQYGIARHTAFGLNSIYVGGDNFHGIVERSPWQLVNGVVQSNPDTIAATRMSDVKNPSKLVVFGPSHFWQSGSSPPPEDDKLNVLLGYCELRPPMANYNRDTAVSTDPQWAVFAGAGPNNGKIILNGLKPGGVPVDRMGGDKIPTAHLDGSVDSEFILRLQADMSRWSPFAISNQ